MNFSTMAAIAALCAAAAPARAQPAETFANGLATAMEAVGQGVGESAVAGPSIFLTATGRAPLPDGAAVWYAAEVETSAPSAVEAGRKVDDRLAAIRAMAQRSGAILQIGPTAFSLGGTGVNGAFPFAPPALTVRPAAPGVATPPEGPRFTAKSSVRFRVADPARLPAFLDALRSAGVDAVTGGPAQTSLANLFQNSEWLGLGNLDKVDDAIWDRAGQAAVAEARRQATVLAAAAGRTLGPARQVMVLTRSAQNGVAAVTVSVRFALAPS